MFGIPGARADLNPEASRLVLLLSVCIMVLAGSRDGKESIVVGTEQEHRSTLPLGRVFFVGYPCPYDITGSVVSRKLRVIVHGREPIEVSGRMSAC